MIDLKQELGAANQRVTLLDKRCLDLSNETTGLKAREDTLRYELETLKEEKFNQNIGSEKSAAALEQENQEMRAEIESLLYQIGVLQAKRNLAIEIPADEEIKGQPEYKQTVSTEDSPRKEIAISNAIETKLLEERCAALSKEKKSLEEILER